MGSSTYTSRDIRGNHAFGGPTIRVAMIVGREVQIRPHLSRMVSQGVYSMLRRLFVVMPLAVKLWSLREQRRREDERVAQAR